MKRLLIIFSLIIILVMVMPATAQEGPSSALQANTDVYIVVMKSDPVIAYQGNIHGLASTKPVRGAKIDPSARSVRAYQEYLTEEHNAALKSAGVPLGVKIYDYTIALNGMAVQLTEAQLAKLAKHPGVLLLLPDQIRYKTTDSSPEFLGLTVRGGPWDKGITGEDVVVGVIDTGIWPEHPSFADDGSYTSLADYAGLPCEFGNTAHNPNDAPFTCNNKLLGARQMLATYRALTGVEPDEFDSARDDDGHGTHTASTAAGNAGVEATVLGTDRGTISGIAPRARVIAYKGLGNLGGYTSDLAAAIDQAVADGVDVINYSIGGGAAGPGADEIAFLFAADAGVFVATSAGNSGSGAATVGNPGTMPWLTTVGASTQSRFFQATLRLGNGVEFKGASITPGVDWAPLVDAEFAGGDLCIPGDLDPALVSGKIVLCRRGAIARVDKSLAVQQAGGVGMIMYENSDIGNLFSDSHWVPSVHIDNTPGLVVKAYIAAATNPRAKITAEQLGVWPHAPTMADFSSRGPNPVAPDIIKPDITAPGFQILAGNSPFPDPGYPEGELFQAIAGTSMSSPHVAGAFALIKQAHPDWSAAAAKSALMTTASQKVRDNDRVSEADPFDMGAGHLNVGGRTIKGSAFQPGLVYEAGLTDYLGFLCGTFPEVFGNPASTCASLDAAGIPTEAYNLNYPSIGIAELAGKQTVKRTVTCVAEEEGARWYRAKVVAPPGYRVRVKPAKLWLANGEVGEYKVTIKNISAPVDEWRFGSIKWIARPSTGGALNPLANRRGKYKVYSPIAVKAKSFSAPSELSRSGTEGTVGFDVTFGYTGAYSANPHGLVGATVTSENVLQDPDQTFQLSDVGSGGANLHQFNLSDVTYFRVAMPPEATEANADLDIYVYDPNGELFASSTSGGTNEVIDIMQPMNGIWSVYVHGWAAPGGDSDYDMWSWAVPQATGGSLQIVSAPASATTGKTEKVKVGWSGLSSGSAADWYLGAVSHTGDPGFMGLTLVNVDNR